MQPVPDEVVPATRVASPRALEAGHVEPVSRARHGDVEQPVALAPFLPGVRGARRRHHRHARGALYRPDERLLLVEGAAARELHQRGLAPDVEHVSGRNTIGASRPLAPCTVMTRTSLRPCSMSRLTWGSERRSQPRKPDSEGAGAVVVGERELEELVEGIGGVGPEPREHAPTHAVAVEDAGEELVGGMKSARLRQRASVSPASRKRDSAGWRRARAPTRASPRARPQCGGGPRRRGRTSGS